MIKNKLYPYIEKYINEYLYGFTKEQLNVGVMNGQIALENLTIRPDQVNEKLDLLEVPVWLKAGQINKIQIGCSLMNFLGEKPLEVNIEKVDLVISPSLKWVVKNKPTFIEENEYHIRDPYDPMDNNSHDIFNRKVNIYDSSVIKKKKKIYEILTDKSRISEIINKIFTRCLSFYYQKPYLINLKIHNLCIRFEDDMLINFQSDIAMGMELKLLEINLSAEGSNKKNHFKCENFNLYWEPEPKILIPAVKFLNNLDRDNKLDEKYFTFLKQFFTTEKNSFSTNLKSSKSSILVDNFNCMGNFGVSVIDSGNLDFFSKNREKNYKLYIQIATADMNINVYPQLFEITTRFVDFVKSFFILEPIQDFKPMRKPYNRLSDLVKKIKNDPKFEYKRKMVVRDWLYYMVWFNRFKKAIYQNSFTNSLHDEYSKYFNICCLPSTQLDSSFLNNNQNNSIDAAVKNDGLGRKEEMKTNPENPSGEESSLNPENITLIVVSEILIKGVNLNFFTGSNPNINPNTNNALCFKFSSFNVKYLISKEKFDFNFDVKNFYIELNNLKNNTSNKLTKPQISKNLDDFIREEILNKNMMSKRSQNYIQKNSVFLNSFSKNEDSILESASLFSPKVDDNISISSNFLNEKNNLKIKKTILINESEDTSREMGLFQNNQNQSTNKIKVTGVSKPSKKSEKFFGKETTGKKSKKFLNILLEHDPKINLEETSNTSNLSKVINEYNRMEIREKKIKDNISKFNTNRMEMSSYNSQAQLINLNLVEAYPFKNNDAQSHSSIPTGCVFSFKYSKYNNEKIENLNINLGSIRINVIQEFANVLLLVLKNYNIFQSVNRDRKKVSEFFNFKSSKKLNDLRFYILERLKSPQFTQLYSNKNMTSIEKDNNQNVNNSFIFQQKKISSVSQEISDYMKYLKSTLEISSDDNFKYEVNSIFNLFHNRNYEVNFQHQDVFLFFFSHDLENCIGKVKLPNFNFKLQIKNYFSKNSNYPSGMICFMDFELCFFDIEQLKYLTNNLLKKIEQDNIWTNINFYTSMMIQPVMNKITLEKKNEEFSSHLEENSHNVKKFLNGKMNKNSKQISKAIQNKNLEDLISSPYEYGFDMKMNSCPEKFGRIDSNLIEDIQSNIEENDELQETIPFEEQEMSYSHSQHTSNLSDGFNSQIKSEQNVSNEMINNSISHERSRENPTSEKIKMILKDEKKSKKIKSNTLNNVNQKEHEDDPSELGSDHAGQINIPGHTIANNQNLIDNAIKKGGSIKLKLQNSGNINLYNISIK